MPENDPIKNDDKKIEPLTLSQKISWNNFLRFLYKRGYYGNPLLDERDKDLGHSLMEEYNRLNPKDTLDYNTIIPSVQQSFINIQDGKGFNGNEDSSFYSPLIKDVILRNGRKLSPVDGWLGSLTSTQAFPDAISPDGKSFGVNYDAFNDYVKSFMKNTNSHFNP